MAVTKTMTPAQPHCFVPILPGIHHRLLLPAAFFKKYLGNEDCGGVGKDALLRSPSGKLWTVKISGRRIGFGWPEFARAHDLVVGGFLVFRHSGDMVFDVTVLEPNACTPQYPLPTTVLHREEEQEQQHQQVPHPTAHAFENTVGKKAAAFIPRKLKATPHPRESPSYEGTLKPYPNELGIPYTFARACGFCDNYCETVIVRNQQGMAWPVRLRKRNGYNRFNFGSGWKDFHVANGLKSGQSFKIQLIEQGVEPVFNFCVRNSEDEVVGKEALEATTMQVAINVKAEAISPTTPRSPFFMSILTQRCLSKYELNIPKAFAKENGLYEWNCDMDMIMKDQEGRSWPVKLSRYRASGVMIIGRGWRPFALANGLKVGESFTIELVKDGNEFTLNFQLRR